MYSEWFWDGESTLTMDGGKDGGVVMIKDIDSHYGVPSFQYSHLIKPKTKNGSHPTNHLFGLL